MRPVWYHPIPLVTSFRVEANIELKGFPNKALLTWTSGKSRVLSGLWKWQGKYCCCLLSIFYRYQATEAMSKSFSTTFFTMVLWRSGVTVYTAFCSSLCPRAERDGRNLWPTLGGALTPAPRAALRWEAASFAEWLAQGHLGNLWQSCKWVCLNLKHKIAFCVLFLNSPQRSVKLLAVRCFQYNYRVISEAFCGVWVSTMGSRHLHCFQRNQDTEIKKSDSSTHSFCVYTMFLEEWSTVQLWKSIYFACNKHDAVQ